MFRQLVAQSTVLLGGGVKDDAHATLDVLDRRVGVDLDHATGMSSVLADAGMSSMLATGRVGAVLTPGRARLAAPGSMIVSSVIVTAAGGVAGGQRPHLGVHLVVHPGHLASPTPHIGQIARRREHERDSALGVLHRC